MGASMSVGEKMKKTLPLIVILACCLQSSSFAFDQSAEKTKSEQTRQVKGQVLTSTHLPAIRVRFDDKFKYVGTQKFILYDKAEVEQYFFVDADSQRRIKRMYMVQFEGFLPGIDAAYDYPATETVTLGGQTYLVNAETIPNVPAALKQIPGSDVARAASLLESKGYRISESIRFQRFVRLLDEAKRNEILLLYIEDAGAGASADREKEFLARALEGFTILN
jgi:hypothetical protein